MLNTNFRFIIHEMWLTMSAKFKSMKDLLRGKSILVAFSGGVDSSVLAYIAKEVAEEVFLLHVDSPLSPRIDYEYAQRIAEEIGLKLAVSKMSQLDIEEFRENPEDRCYFCKRVLAKEWSAIAEKLGAEVVVEGTTASDLEGHRPGKRALKEIGITSPFLEFGITKDEIREYARGVGLSVADRPSMACLATRIPYGIEITEERIEMVGKVEQFARDIFELEIVRARYHGNLVRLEVGYDERDNLFDMEKLDRFVDYAQSVGFTYVTFDALGYRTGSMDEILDL